MGIKQVTPIGTIDKKIDEQAERAKKALIRFLHYVGEKVVNTARSLPTPPVSLFWNSETGSHQSSIPSHTPNYIDWTANLRSSIGYVIVVDGKVYNGNNPSFEVVSGSEGSGQEGAKEGKEYAKRLAQKYPTGVTLIVVAGMNYAKYVQARGYDVTLSAEHLATQLLQQLGTPNIKRIE